MESASALYTSNTHSPISSVIFGGDCSARPFPFEAGGWDKRRIISKSDRPAGHTISILRCFTGRLWCSLGGWWKQWESLCFCTVILTVCFQKVFVASIPLRHSASPQTCHCLHLIHCGTVRGLACGLSSVCLGFLSDQVIFVARFMAGCYCLKGHWLKKKSQVSLSLMKLYLQFIYYIHYRVSH